MEETLKHYKDKFHSDTHTTLDPFEGDPKLLNNPFTPEEVAKGLKKLNNNKAAGEDEIPGELLKYGPEALTKTLTECINEMFRTHTALDINKGVLVSIQKPGKEKGPLKNQRPITLLTTMRKLLSIPT